MRKRSASAASSSESRAPRPASGVPDDASRPTRGAALSWPRGAALLSAHARSALGMRAAAAHWVWLGERTTLLPPQLPAASSASLCLLVRWAPRLPLPATPSQHAPPGAPVHAPACNHRHCQSVSSGVCLTACNAPPDAQTLGAAPQTPPTTPPAVPSPEGQQMHPLPRAAAAHAADGCSAMQTISPGAAHAAVQLQPLPLPCCCGVHGPRPLQTPP
jgi:hypothetical protein